MKLKGSKKIVSFLMSLVLIVSCFAVPIVAKADVPTVSGKSGIILGGYGGNNNVRHDGEIYNIVNDGNGENTTAAFWSYSINSNIKNAATIVDLQPYFDIDDLSLELYYVNPSLVSDYVAEGGKHTLVDAIESTDADSRHQYFLDTFQCSDNLITTFDHKTRGQKALNLTTAVAKSLENGWSEVCIMAILSKNNNGSSSNVWSDYHVTMSALKNYTVDSVKGLLTDFEDKFNSISASNVLTNVKPAYDAYVSLIKGYDAYYYGDNTSITLSSLAANLEIAMSNISTVKQNFDATAYFGSNVATGAYSNVVYAPAATSNNYSANTKLSDNDAQAKYGITNNLVVVNNRSESYIPIVMQMWGSKSSILVSNWKSYVKTTQFTYNNAGSASALLKQNWCYVKNADDTSWTAPTSNLVVPIDYNGSTDYQLDSKSMYYNRLYVSSSNTNTYYDKINFSDFTLKCKGHFTYSYFGNKDKSYEGTVSNPSGQVYVINYASVMSKVNDIVAKVANLNVSDYKENGLASILSAYDTCTGANPNNFDYASNIERAVDSCGQAISDAIKATYTEPTTDSNYTKYDSLRNAIDSSREYVSTNYTADSLVAYGKAIKDAKNVFGSLNFAANGYNSPADAQAKATALNNAKSALDNANVDTDDAYSNFDAAVTVVNAMDTDAFIDSNTVANKVASAKAQVYTTLTDSADIEAYTLATGTAPSGELKNSVAVDAVTKELLDFANEPSANLIKDIAVTFGAQIQKDNKEPVTAGETSNTYKYGTMVTFDANSFADVSALGDNKSIKWTVNYADKTISKFATNTTSITIKATKGMTVTANVIDETPNTEAVNYTVKLYNIYNNIVDYVYVSEPLTAGFHEGSSIDVNGKAWTIDIPFYTLTGFDVAVYESSKTITVKPHYDAVNTVSVNVINGSATGNKLTDNSAVKSSSVYISTNVDSFYAWANVKDDKYQIISYNKDYGYAAISDGNYTPVVKENGTYYVYTSDSQKTELKASMIDQFKNNSDYGLSPDQYFFTKLDNYAPFTYIEDDSKSADGKYRVFIRVTSGSNDEYKKAFDSFGVYGYGSKIPFTTVNEISGQYTFTSSVLPSDFNAYVSYKMTYTDKTGSYSITTTDFAKNA